MRYNSVRSGQRVLHMTLRLIRTGWNRRGKAAAAREQGLELDYGRDAKRIKELIEQPGEGTARPRRKSTSSSLWPSRTTTSMFWAALVA